jgi:hypothetical protein
LSSGTGTKSQVPASSANAVPLAQTTTPLQHPAVHARQVEPVVSTHSGNVSGQGGVHDSARAVSKAGQTLLIAR